MFSRIVETWHIKVREDHKLRIDLEEGLSRHKLRLYLDDRLTLEQDIELATRKGCAAFEVDGETLQICWVWRWGGTKRKSVEILRKDVVIAALGDGRSVNRSVRAIPVWAWLHINICLLTPIYLLLQKSLHWKVAAPLLLIGVGAAVTCQQIASDPERSPSSRLMICSAITLAAVIGLFILADALMSVIDVLDVT